MCYIQRTMVILIFVALLVSFFLGDFFEGDEFYTHSSCSWLCWVGWLVGCHHRLILIQCFSFLFQPTVSTFFGLDSHHTRSAVRDLS